MSLVFEFSIGPVQTFIHQARRTRDFWAGSRLVAWLAAVAVVSTRHQEGFKRFRNPQYSDEAISRAESGNGSDAFPHRFAADVDLQFDPDAVAADVRKAWSDLETHVWHELEDIPGAADARVVWYRQVPGFWNIQWTISEKPGALTGRKAMQDHGYGEPEPGRICSLMDGWQELSGIEFQRGHGDLDDRRRIFWEQVRKRTGHDLEEGEQLCALAYIKRRLHKHLRNVEITLSTGRKMKGFGIEPQAVPSVMEIAAAPWILKALHCPDRPSRDSFLAQWSRTSDAAALTLPALRGAARQAGASPEGLDAGVLYESTSTESDPKRPDSLKALADAIKKLKIGSPCRYYAILRCDFDNLGGHGDDPIVSAGVSGFAQAAPGHVRGRDGFMVFCGGDDLVALIPAPQALDCAATLHDIVRKSVPPAVTLSAAVLFAHVRAPFAAMLQESQELLIEEAKRGAMKDAIAVGLEQRGARAATWALRWEYALPEEDTLPRLKLSTLASMVKGGGAGFPSRFLMKIRKIVETFEVGGGRAGPDFDQVTDLATAIYLRSFDTDTAPAWKDARERVWPLLEQCRPVQRDRSAPGGFRDADRLRFDAVTLVRFLARECNV